MEDGNTAQVLEITGGEQKPKRREKGRGKKKSPNTPHFYNLHVGLSKETYAVFRQLAGDRGATEYVHQLIVGAAVQNGLIPQPSIVPPGPKPVPAPVEPATRTSCTSVCS